MMMGGNKDNEDDTLPMRMSQEVDEQVNDGHGSLDLGCKKGVDTLSL